MPINTVNKFILKIASWNANGICNKIGELQAFVDAQEIDVIFIQETRISNKTPPKLKNFNPINKPKTTNGGLLIYIHKRLQFHEISTNTIDTESAAIVVSGMCLVNFYSSPNKLINTQELDSLLNLKNQTVIFGDFNSKHTH